MFTRRCELAVLFAVTRILVEAQNTTTSTTTTEPTPPPRSPQIKMTATSERGSSGATATQDITVSTVESLSSQATITITEYLSTSTIRVTPGKSSTAYDLANEPAKIIGIAIGIALICLLIILGGIALQKYIRQQRIKKQETTPPKDFTNPVQISGDTPV